MASFNLPSGVNPNNISNMIFLIQLPGEAQMNANQIPIQNGQLQVQAVLTHPNPVSFIPLFENNNLQLVSVQSSSAADPSNSNGSAFIRVGSMPLESPDRDGNGNISQNTLIQNQSSGPGRPCIAMNSMMLGENNKGKNNTSLGENGASIASISDLSEDMTASLSNFDNPIATAMRSLTKIISEDAEIPTNSSNMNNQGSNGSQALLNASSSSFHDVLLGQYFDRSNPLMSPLRSSFSSGGSVGSRDSGNNLFHSFDGQGSSGIGSPMAAGRILKIGPNLELKFCSYCGKGFKRNADLEQHLRSHTKQKPYQCIICGRAFAQNSQVRKHIDTHKVWLHEVSPRERFPQFMEQELQDPVLRHACPYCDCRFADHNMFKSHLKENHAKEKVFQCSQPSCDVVYKELPQLLAHMPTHSSLIYRCPYCGLDFSDLQSIGVHQGKHAFEKKAAGKSAQETDTSGDSSLSRSGSRPVRTYKCLICNEKFASAAALEHHQKLDPHSYHCPECPNTIFVHVRWYRRHMLRHKKSSEHDLKSWKCSICKKQFEYQSKLLNHITTAHSLTTVKPHECSHCKKGFNSAYDRRRHEETMHLKRNRFVCIVDGCMARFSRKDRLKEHLRIHTGNNRQSFSCEICKDKQFQKVTSYQRHMKLHRGEHAHKCTKCERNFNRKDKLEKHNCKRKPCKSRLAHVPNAGN